MLSSNGRQEKKDEQTDIQKFEYQVEKWKTRGNQEKMGLKFQAINISVINK